MTTGVTCSVFVDGIRAADGSPGEPESEPAILEDLAVTWGRGDTMSQPDPDTCTFKVVDRAGGSAFGDIYRTGARVDVVANGDTFADPSVETFRDPGFEAGLVTWTTTNATATRSTTRANAETYSLNVKPTSSSAPGSVIIAPAPFEPVGTNPDAWDDIPTTVAGQTWVATVAVWAPVGANVTLRPVTFSGPYANAATPLGSGSVLEGSATWQTVSVERTVLTDGTWVGVELVIDPTGPAWDELPPDLAWDDVDPILQWDELGSVYVDDVHVAAPGSSGARGVVVFSGRITDLSAAWDPTWDAPVASIAAAGFTADLENRLIGDEPWTVETVAARSQRILTLAGLPITIDIDTSIDELLLTWRDVDSQGATGLLQEIATSVDGVLWPAVHQSLGAYLRLEDPSLRASLVRLELDGGLIVIVPADPADGFDLSACLILRDSVTFVQTVADVVTRVSVTWLIQGVDDEGKPETTESTVTDVDPAREAELGTRSASVSTQLISADDATDVAARVLARTGPGVWRAEGVTVDDDDVPAGTGGVDLVLDLLDGTSRIGAPLKLGDMPDWAPVAGLSGAYLEGGTYRFVGGRWVLELVVSAATGLGGSAAWDELDPAWTWDQWDPAISWNDLRGVAAP